MAASTSTLKSLVIVSDAVTLRRIIVDCWVQVQEVTDNLACAGRVGIITADARTVAAGIGALPRPFNGGDQEWLWNRGFARKNVGAVGANYALHLHDDVRGMRKMKQGDEVVFVIEALADGVLDFQVSARVLFSV